MLKRIKIVDNINKEVLTMSAQSDEVWAMQNGFSVDLHETETAYDGKEYLKGFAPTQTLSQQAATVSMTKAEFLLLVTNLTPITLADIETYLETDADIKIRFTYANSVERNHPMLEGASAVFNVTPQLLDIMFVNKDELIRKIDAGEAIEGITP